jgi:4-hydroxyphenylpyruvate dioxygenase
MSDLREATNRPANPSARENLGAEIEGNPAGFDGIEFIEYSTSQPQALGQVLELIGFRPIARHRSREVLLYRQGDMNIVINAHQVAKPTDETGDAPSIAAVAFRVRDAAVAYRRAVELGAWPVATHVEVMELNIPALHGVGSTRIYLVDRYREFSIYSVDFVPIPDVTRRRPRSPACTGSGSCSTWATAGLDDWTAYYQEIFGFTALPTTSASASCRRDAS